MGLTWLPALLSDKGMTLLDLAVASDSHNFIETCCKEALDTRYEKTFYSKRRYYLGRGHIL